MMVRTDVHRVFFDTGCEAKKFQKTQEQKARQQNKTATLMFQITNSTKAA